MLTKDDLAVIADGSFTFPQKVNFLTYRFSRPAERVPYQPITISIVATGRCTLACDMCPTHSGVIPKEYPHIQKPTQDISLETFARVVDTFDRALHVQIIGSGEPLLNKDFFEMVEYAARRKHMRVKTFSNGTTIEERIDAIVRSSLDGITISINSHDAEDFHRITGCPHAVYEKIRRAAKRLIEARNASGSKVKVKVSFIIDKGNYKDIPRMVDAGKALGADSIFLCNFLPAPYEGFRAHERMLLADDADAVRTLARISAGLGPELKRIVSFPRVIDVKSARNQCRSHFTQVRVDGEGRVSSCSIMLLNMEGHGYFYEPGVWNNDFFREARRKCLANDKKLLDDPCKVCPDNCGIEV